jgi:hypothetical protein
VYVGDQQIRPNHHKEDEVNLKYLWRVVLIAALCAAISTKAEADQLQKTADTALALAIVGTAALVTVVVVVIHNSNQKRTIMDASIPPRKA